MKTSLLALVLVLGAGNPALAGTPTTAPAAAKAPAKVVPFIHDDYPTALAEARAKKLPLFVETWAAW